MSSNIYIRQKGIKINGYLLPEHQTDNMQECENICNNNKLCIAYTYNTKYNTCQPVSNLANLEYDFYSSSAYNDQYYDPLKITIGNTNPIDSSDFTLSCKESTIPTEFMIQNNNSKITSIGLKCNDSLDNNIINTTKYYSNGLYGNTSGVTNYIKNNNGFNGLVVAGNPNEITGIGIKTNKFIGYGTSSSSSGEFLCSEGSIIKSIKGKANKDQLLNIYEVECTPNLDITKKIGETYVKINEYIDWKTCPNQTSTWF